MGSTNGEYEKGSALIATIVIVLVLLILGGALVQYVLLDLRQAIREEQDVQAYYLARSGADAVAEWMVQNFAQADGIIGKTSDQIPLGDGYFVVKVSEVGGFVEIESTGTIEDREKTVVLVLTRQTEKLSLDMALFAGAVGSSAEPAIELKGSAKIIGTIGTNATGKDSVKLAWSTYIHGGDLLVGSGADIDEVVSVQGADNIERHIPEGIVGEIPAPLFYPLPLLPEFPVTLPYRGDFSTPWRQDLYYPIAEDGWYDVIEVTSNRTLTVDLEGGVRRIRARQLKVSGEIRLINIGENGKLILYIDELFRATDNSRINWHGEGANRPEVLTLYLDGGNPFGMGYDQFRFTGNVITDHTPVKIGAGSEVIGNIVTGTSDVSIRGNAKVKGVVYAPSAHVKVDNSGASGAVVAHRLSASGAAEIRYDSKPLENFPTEVFEAGAGGDLFRYEYQRGHWRQGI